MAFYPTGYPTGYNYAAGGPGNVYGYNPLNNPANQPGAAYQQTAAGSAGMSLPTIHAEIVQVDDEASAANFPVAANARQIANLQQSFNNVRDLDGRLDSISAALAQCCCDNRLATESLRATVLAENCADRFEAQRNTADIIASGNANTQRIVDTINGGTKSVIDKLCQLELDGYKRENDNLRQQLNTATIRNTITDGNDQLYSRLQNCPIPAMPVYGNSAIFQCPQTVAPNYGCRNCA